jgi:hypothetical protein
VSTQTPQAAARTPAGIRASPLVMVLITRVSGSMVAQQVRSVPTLLSIKRIAAACKSATPSPEAASAAISRRARYARSSHTAKLFHCFQGEAFPGFWDHLGSKGSSRSVLERACRGGHRPSDRTRVASMATKQSSAVIERVWSRLPDGAREVLESELSPTDLQSLLLSVAQTRAAESVQQRRYAAGSRTGSCVPA